MRKKQPIYDTESKSQILSLEDGAQYLGLRVRKVRKWCREGMRIGFIRRGTTELMIIYRGITSEPPKPKPRKVTGNLATNIPPEVWKQASTITTYPPALTGWRNG